MKYCYYLINAAIRYAFLVKSSINNYCSDVFFYALLALVFLPNISNLFIRWGTHDKSNIVNTMSSNPLNSCFLFICNVSINPVSGTYAVRKATSRVDFVQARLSRAQLHSDTLLQQDYLQAHGWHRHALEWARLENSFYDQLSTARNTVPPVSQNVLNTLNRRMMDASINGRTAEGHAAIAKVKLEMTAQNITARLSTVQQQVESAQGHLELLGYLNEMNFFERVVYSISRSPTTMKILSYSLELLCYHYAESPVQFSYLYYQ
jgi:hypothetical protein